MARKEEFHIDDFIEKIGMKTWMLWLPIYILGWAVIRLWERLRGEEKEES
jgi:hypothetical protein